MNAQIQVTGRYKAEVHTGHTFDDAGNIIEYGKVLRESAWSDNKILLAGFEQLLTHSYVPVWLVAGTGNTTPIESNTLLDTYKGAASVCASYIYAYNDTPDVDGNVYLRSTWRYTFNPGDLGATPVNIAEAGMAYDCDALSATAISPLLSRGLLVDTYGAPTTVSVDPVTEYLDIIWQYTEYFPVSVSGTVSLTIDGVPTSHDWVSRPCNWRQLAAADNYTWPQHAPGGNRLNGFGLMLSDIGYSVSSWTAYTPGPIGLFTDYPTGMNNTDARIIKIWTRNAYVASSKQQTFSVTSNPVDGNVVGGIGAIVLQGNRATWQVSYDPVILKVDTKQLDLAFTISMANK